MNRDPADVRRLILIGVVAVVACVFAGTAIAELLSGPDRAHTHSLAPVLYVSPSGSDGTLCTQRQPCKSFDRAYEAAAPGSTVLVTCGSASSCTYPVERISRGVSKQGPTTCRWREPFRDGGTAQNLSGCVTFRPAPHASPVLEGLTVSSPGVMADGLRTDLANGGGVNVGWDPQVGGSCSEYGVHDVVLKDVSAKILNVNGVHYLYVIGGSYGPNDDNSSNIEPCYLDGSDYSNTDHVALDGTTFHDYLQLQAGDHDECIHWQDTDQGLVRNSRFLNCAQQDISFHPRDFGIDRLTHFTIENNVFDVACSHQQAPCGHVSGGGLVFGCNPSEPLGDFVIRFNSFGSGDEGLEFDSFLDECAKGSGGFAITGNILGGPVYNLECTNTQNRDGAIWSYNLFFGKLTCGVGSRPGASPSSTYVDESRYDFRLKTGSPAVDLVPATVARPATDLRGAGRPLRFRADAGAFQWDPVRIVLGHSIGAIRIGRPAATAISFYGQPRARTTLSVGKARLDRLTFRSHLGSLWALVDRGVVVGVGTGSPYYTTPNGIGVAGGTALVRVGSGSNWVDCRGAFQRNFGQVGVFVAPQGGRAGKRIANITMVENRYAYGTC